jgi:hypothetical protein
MKNPEKIREIEETKELEPAFDLKPIRHGLRACAMMLKGENRRYFNELCNSLELEWLPRTPTEHFYVEQMAVSQWKLQRMQIVEYDIFFDKSPSAPGQIPTLERLIQCQLRLERSYSHAQHDLQRLQKTRPRQAPVPPEPIVFTPDPPRDTEPLESGPGAQVIDISTGTATKAPEGAESPTTHNPPGVWPAQPTAHNPPGVWPAQPTAHNPPATGQP